MQTSGVFVVVVVVKRKLLRKQFNSSSVSFLGWGQSNQPRDIFASLSEAKAFAVLYLISHPNPEVFRAGW